MQTRESYITEVLASDEYKHPDPIQTIIEWFVEIFSVTEIESCTSFLCSSKEVASTRG